MYKKAAVLKDDIREWRELLLAQLQHNLINYIVDYQMYIGPSGNNGIVCCKEDILPNVETEPYLIFKCFSKHIRVVEGAELTTDEQKVKWYYSEFIYDSDIVHDHRFGSIDLEKLSESMYPFIIKYFESFRLVRIKQ